MAFVEMDFASGGSGSGMTYNELLSSPFNVIGTYNLNDDISNYKAIIVTMVTVYQNKDIGKKTSFLPKILLDNMSRVKYEFMIDETAIVDNSTICLGYVHFSFPTNTSISADLMAYNTTLRAEVKITSVIGVN